MTDERELIIYEAGAVYNMKEFISHTLELGQHANHLQERHTFLHK